MSDTGVLLYPFLSGVAGVLVSPFLLGFWDWCKRPVLTVPNTTDDDGTIIQQPVEHSTTFKQWVRIRVGNKGRSTAQGVRVLLVSIEGRAPMHPSWVFRKQTVDCLWSHLDDLSKIDIPSQTERFADVLSLDPVGPGVISPELRFTGKGGGSVELGISNRLTLRFAITADNAKTVFVDRVLEYDGAERGFRIGVDQ